ncbi:carbohydrate binding domain-containing protein [Psychromonas sp. MME1]|uniref:carbohydrate binding domain-containing protein n=1 Tax=Psychromonas sp. MME1 TaxID=3231032 RepID=UPI0034E22BE4
MLRLETVLQQKKELSNNSQSKQSESGELLQNPQFKKGEESWWVSGGQLAVKNGEACVNITQPGSNNWDVILGQGGLGLENGQSYQVNFTARSSVETKFKALIQHDGAPYTGYFNEDISVGPTAKTYSFNFTQKEPSDAKTGFQFQLGAQKKLIFVLVTSR